MEEKVVLLTSELERMRFQKDKEEKSRLSLEERLTLIVVENERLVTQHQQE